MTPFRVITKSECVAPKSSFALSVVTGLDTFADGVLADPMGRRNWGPWGSNPSCSNGSAAKAIIMTQGDTDGTVTPALGQATRDFWLDRANCQANGSPSQDFTPNCTEYTCDAGLPVVYCTHGGNHFVPGEAGPRGWDFFQSLD